MSDFGQINSLGISSGVLNYDIIDKLKKADENIKIRPIENKINLIKKKEKALNEFITIASIVKSDIMDIANGTTFAKIDTNVNGKSIEVKTNDGVKPQEFSINVINLAKNDIYESKGFSSIDSIINLYSEPVTLELGIGENTVNINLEPNATLNDLKNIINNSKIGITASIINTGIDNNPYKLILKANKTGKDNIIKFDYSKIENLGLNTITYISKDFNSDTDTINNTGNTQTFSIIVNGTKYSMDIADGTKIKDFIDDINNGKLKNSNGNSLGISAKFEDSKIKFYLKAIGDISIYDNNLLTNFNNNTDFNNLNRIQKAENAKFTYNGVEIERNKNNINDLIVGININLKSNGYSSVSISKNEKNIIKQIKKFILNYNTMINNIQNLTDFNKDTGNIGLFQGNSDFNKLKNIFTNDLFNTTYSYYIDKQDKNGNKYTKKGILNAVTVGFDINRNGMLSFNEEKFKNEMKKYPNIVKKWFEITFNKIKSNFERTITNKYSNLNILNKKLKDDEINYNERIKNIEKFLDVQYNILANQFAMYDTIINKLNSKINILKFYMEQSYPNK